MDNVAGLPDQAHLGLIWTASWRCACMTTDRPRPADAGSNWTPAGLRTTARGWRRRAAAGGGGGDSRWPPLLLCNGIGARLELLQPFVDALDPRRAVIRFDVPGIGGSPE